MENEDGEETIGRAGHRYRSLDPFETASVCVRSYEHLKFRPYSLGIYEPTSIAEEYKPRLTLSSLEGFLSRREMARSR